MLLVMFSLAGMPPTIGFYAKFAVLEAAVGAGFVWLAVVAVLAVAGRARSTTCASSSSCTSTSRSTPRRIVARGDNRRAAVRQRPRAAVLRHPAAAADGAAARSRWRSRASSRRRAGPAARAARAAESAHACCVLDTSAKRTATPCASASSSPASST